MYQETNQTYKWQKECTLKWFFLRKNYLYFSLTQEKHRPFFTLKKIEIEDKEFQVIPSSYSTEQIMTKRVMW
jgi:hypothetical protein